MSLTRGLPFVFGLVLLFGTYLFSEQLAELIEPKPGPSKVKPIVVAEVTKVNGTAFLANRSDRPMIVTNQKLAPESRIVTDKNSSVRVKIRSGHRIEISENADVLLHQWADKYVVYKNSGEVKLLNSTGAVDQLVIASKNHSQFIEEKLNRKNIMSDSDSPQDSSIGATSGPSNNQIRLAVRKLVPQFERCYRRLVTTVENIAGGKVLINFQIENTGRIENAKMARTSIKDESFTRCLLTVIQRAKLPSFEGPAVMASYPMTFK